MTHPMTHTHTHTHHTLGRAPLDEKSACRRGLYLTTHNTHNRQISMPRVGFEPAVATSERPQTHALNQDQHVPEHMEKYGRAGQATYDNIRRMRIACWITKATNTHSEYAIFIAFLRQQWLRERASIFHYMYCTLPVFVPHVDLFTGLLTA
jgi:hypothetical protein